MIVMLFTTTFMHIQELIHKLTTGQIRLRVLDLRGLEVVVTPQFFLPSEDSVSPCIFVKVKIISLIVS